MEHDLESYEKLVLDDSELPVKIVVNYKTERGTYFKAHWHEFMELHFVVSGHAQISLNHEHIAVNQGELLVINSNILHRGYCDGTPVEVLVLVFELKEISKEMANDNAIFQSKISEDSKIQHIMTKIYQEYKERQLGYRQLCKGAILELLVYLSRSYVAERLSDSGKQKHLRKLERLNTVNHHIRKHYREPISNAELAALIHLSEDRFCHLFKEAMGMSPLQYLNEVRLKKAMYLLSTGEYAATQVADAVGFTDYNHFGRLFRRYYGCTPMQAKKNNQNKEVQLQMDGFNLQMTRETEEADVIVIGGGPAGMCAAIAAARLGVSVVLIEQGGCCGGMATRGLVGPFMTCYDAAGKEMIIRGLFEEIVNRMVERGYALHPSGIRAGTAFTSWIQVGHEHVTPFEPEGLKLVIDDMLSESGVKVFYHTDFLYPIVQDSTITGVVLSAKQGLFAIKGKVVIDCTGDGDVAYRSGVPCEKGNEELGITQPASMFFYICNVDSDVVEADIQANIHNFYRKDGVNYRSFHWRVSEAVANGDWSLNRVSIGMFRMPQKDEWFVNTSRLLGEDATDSESLTTAEIDGRRQVEHIMKFLRKYVPGCENAKLKCFASYVGIRESRHVLGEYRLTAEDLLQGRVTDDSILLAANSVDVHGRFGPASNEYVPIKGKFYGVPYRSLIAKGVEQLLIAGRCVSADSTAAGAIRVMPPCMAMGQAAGTAAALSVQDACSVRQVDVLKLRQTLIENGACL